MDALTGAAERSEAAPRRASISPLGAGARPSPLRLLEPAPRDVSAYSHRHSRSLRPRCSREYGQDAP
jgi:hypothetical protein